MSDDERITLVLSDLHVGGGPADPGDDHIYHDDQLVSFVKAQAATPEGRAGRLELFFNGDFLEFAQTNVGAFSLLSDKRWCTALESLSKLDTIIAGHRDIFEALGEFQKDGNVVTIAAGNHDVDLWWPRVQGRIREVAGAGVRFEVGKEWVERYAGRLQIAHGHMSDVANRFEHWERPIVAGPFGIECLEMCPGTLFMVKFVNRLEAEYPFADNLLPVTRLGWVLLNDDKSGLVSVGWMFARMFATTSFSVLEAEEQEDLGTRLLTRIQGSRSRVAALDAILAAQEMNEERAWLAQRRLTPERLAALMFALLGRIELQEWKDLFELPPGSVVLGSDEHDVTLNAIRKAKDSDGKEDLRRVARKRARIVKQTSVVVMGHTHQQDELEWEGKKYYNPGCWTRYLELRPGRKVTLEDLRDESKYPYALNVVRVEPAGGALLSQMVNIDRYPRLP